MSIMWQRWNEGMATIAAIVERGERARARRVNESGHIDNRLSVDTIDTIWVLSGSNARDVMGACLPQPSMVRGVAVLPAWVL